MNKTRNNVIAKLLGRAVAFVAVIAVAVSSIGCSFLRDVLGSESVAFDKKSLSIEVGETFDLSDIISTTSSSYSLESSDSAVASVDEKTSVLTGVGVGAATVTVETDFASDTLKVTVTEKEPDTFGVEYVGELVQNAGGMSDVVFTAHATGAYAKIDTVQWYVNGRYVKLLSRTESFTYTPDAVGNYEITAKCGSATSDAITVRVYGDVAVNIGYRGALEQDGQPFSDIVFSVTVEDDATDKYFQWYEDDLPVYEGELTTFTYSPTPGRHTLSVRVNGKAVYSVSGVFRGSVAAQIGKLEYDNLYPHAYLSYTAVGKAQIEVTDPNGGVSEYSQDNSAYAPLFGDKGFDMGGVIELCAAGPSRRSYKFRVKSLGDGDVITASDYSAYLTFTQLPQGAKKYISTVLPCGDLYITSDKEYVSVAEHYIIFRGKTAGAKVTFDCYIAYNRTGSADDLWNEAFPIAATSGLYTEINATDIGGSVMRTSFKVSSVNNPSRQTSGSYAEQLHAILPHINYDARKYRPSNYEFAIDRLERQFEVTYSDELYLAAQSGAKPLPKSGSAAETVYAMARDVLRKICTDGMSDAQKAHAIYDWIMWQVTYDTPATTIRSSENYSAYYLEGVFGNGKTSIGGVKYDPYAVCDGMSKAYALMCNIEGIPCVRVVGEAGESLRDAGGHAWNKVFIDGAWYVVDCTWGDSHGNIALGSSQMTEYELGLHDHLFVTDKQVAATHFEPYRYANTSIRFAPTTAADPYDVYSNIDINGTQINCVIKKYENQTARLREIATAFASAYEPRSSITVPGGPNDGTYAIGYQGIEIYVEGDLTLSDSAVSSTLSAAFKNVHRNATVRTVMLSNVVLMLVR